MGRKAASSVLTRVKYGNWGMDVSLCLKRVIQHLNMLSLCISLDPNQLTRYPATFGLVLYSNVLCILKINDTWMSLTDVVFAHSCQREEEELSVQTPVEHKTHTTSPEIHKQTIHNYSRSTLWSAGSFTLWKRHNQGWKKRELKPVFCGVLHSYNVINHKKKLF